MLAFLSQGLLYRTQVLFGSATHNKVALAADDCPSTQESLYKFGLKLTDFCPKCSHQVMDHEVDAVKAARHNGRGNTKATDIAVYNQRIGFGIDPFEPAHGQALRA